MASGVLAAGLRTMDDEHLSVAKRAMDALVQVGTHCLSLMVIYLY